VIVATLAHLAPTVVGTRLRARRSSRLAVLGLALSAPAVAIGYAAGLDAIARLGAAAALAGAAGVVAHAVVVHRDPDRGTWTTDAGWHRVTSWSLLLGQAWFGFGLGLTALRTLVSGADPAGWSLAAVVTPLVIGGVAQILVGAMTHLLPAIGPGDPARHGSQRRLLGSAASVRIAALNLGSALLAVGLGAGVGPWWLTNAGLILAGLGVGSSIALLVTAALPAVRTARPAGEHGGPGH
jgi:nitrite reductase (NO-forming)